MHEDFLHFIWKYKLFDDFILFNFQGNDFEILNQGEHNFNSGPDFLGAKIKTSEAIWVGNIEIHQKSSDWFLHNHHIDKSYNNVILQIVKKHDKEIYTESGRLVPVMEISVAETMEKKYLEFLNNKSHIPCHDDLKHIDEFKLKIWLGNVLVERLNKKAEHILKLLKLNNNDWEETFYQLLARSFGFNVNSEPFEWLAKSVPLKHLVKHSNNLLQLEAMLFGQAGFLVLEKTEEEYYIQLKKEYEFLKNKFTLIPLEKHVWKFLRLRPSNFPYIRISQFAILINKSKSLFSKITSCNTITELEKLFKIKASEYWNNHYTFEKTSESKAKVLGKNSINSIIINTAIPILFVYGKNTDNESIKERAIQFLEDIKPEQNSVTKQWEKSGVRISSGFYSQSLIELKNSYCKKIKCLNCGIGIEILKNQTQKKLSIG